MNGTELREARAALGKLWKLDRPLHLAEIGRALRLTGRDPGETVLKWERGNGPSGPASVAIEMMLAGSPPPDDMATIISQRGWPSVVTALEGESSSE